MVFKVCAVDSLSLVYFQMGTAQITLLSSDVWHKRLQIMGCWGERDTFFSFFFSSWTCLENNQTQRTFHFRPACSLSSALIKPQGSSTAFSPTCSNSSGYSVFLEQSIWLNLLSANQCEETTQHNWYRMWWCMFFFPLKLKHTHTHG